jgi:hypothetical protein
MLHEKELFWYINSIFFLYTTEIWRQATAPLCLRRLGSDPAVSFYQALLLYWNNISCANNKQSNTKCKLRAHLLHICADAAKPSSLLLPTDRRDIFIIQKNTLSQGVRHIDEKTAEIRDPQSKNVDLAHTWLRSRTKCSFLEKSVSGTWHILTFDLPL